MTASEGPFSLFGGVCDGLPSGQSKAFKNAGVSLVKCQVVGMPRLAGSLNPARRQRDDARNAGLIEIVSATLGRPVAFNPQEAR